MTISLCMIVKNEENVLARCLDTVADLCDEIVIVDTGSSDRTKEIAAKYTDKIFDFAWIGDFSAARNYAFSLCTCDYIYSADADEVLDEENRTRFRVLKEKLLPEIEIVQMKYGNQLQFGTVYNFDEEYRPKLFKRLRTFTWIEPVHEQMRLDPVVFDSDIVITHMPESDHSGRDFQVFLNRLSQGENLSSRLWEMYSRELYLAYKDNDFLEARPYFINRAGEDNLSADEAMPIYLVAAKAALVASDEPDFFKYVMKLLVMGGCSEICLELGRFYEKQGDFAEASLWYHNAASETEAILVANSKELAAEALLKLSDK